VITIIATPILYSTQLAVNYPSMTSPKTYTLDEKLNFLCVLLTVEVMFHTPIRQKIEPNFLIWGNSALYPAPDWCM